MQAYLDQDRFYKKKRNARLKIYFGGGAGILVLIGLFYAAAYSPVFKIKKFEISGAEDLDEKSVLEILEPLVFKTKADYFFGENNLLSWSVAKPDVSMTALAEASIDRDWLRQSVRIQIKERERVAIWCDSNRCYWLGADGIFFEEAPLAEGSLILIVFDSGPVFEGRKAVEERFVKNLIAVLKGVADFRLPIKKINFDRRLQEIIIKSYSGPDLYFSIRFDPALNLASLHSLKETIGFKNIQYVDLRVENRIFYKNL